MKITQELFDAAMHAKPLPVRLKDCQAIQEAIDRAQMNIKITVYEAELIWERYSGVRAAQWISIIDSETVTEAIREFVIERLKLEEGEDNEN